MNKQVDMVPASQALGFRSGTKGRNNSPAHSCLFGMRTLYLVLSTDQLFKSCYVLKGLSNPLLTTSLAIRSSSIYQVPMMCQAHYQYSLHTIPVAYYLQLEMKKLILREVGDLGGNI